MVDKYVPFVRLSVSFHFIGHPTRTWLILVIVLSFKLNFETINKIDYSICFDKIEVKTKSNYINNKFFYKSIQLRSYFYSQKAGRSLTFIDHEVILVPRETAPIAQPSVTCLAHCESPMKIVKIV